MKDFIIMKNPPPLSQKSKDMLMALKDRPIVFDDDCKEASSEVLEMAAKERNKRKQATATA